MPAWHDTNPYQPERIVRGVGLSLELISLDSANFPGEISRTHSPKNYNRAQMQEDGATSWNERSSFS
jgi:hypothetical protein